MTIIYFNLKMKKFSLINAFLFSVLGLVSVTYCVSHWPSKPDIQTKLLDDDELDGQVSLYLYHSLEPADSPPIYNKRGIITINSARNEATYIEDSPLTANDIEKLKKLASSEDFYRVKILSKPDDPEVNSVFSFTKACAIYESELTNTITVAVDQSYVPVSVSISAVPPYCLGNLVPPKLSTFNTSVNVVSLVNGPSPDILTYIQRLEQEKAEKARGEQGDNRSFLAKYWMYIVPFLIFLFISGASSPEGQGGGR